MTASREMPKYQSHKQVWALKIKTVAVHASGDTAVSDAEFQATDAFQGAHLITVEDGYAPFHVSADWFRKHKPEAGGYYVVYEDGYKSYSPASAFEAQKGHGRSWVSKISGMGCPPSKSCVVRPDSSPHGCQ